MSEPVPASNDAMFQAMRKVPGTIWRTYLAPEPKVMFESLNKNACTSLKWMMADLAGEDLSTFKAGIQPFIVDSEAVHNRELWKVSPKLDQLSVEQRAEIRPENGWFIFAVVRDPRLRVFSAWQNKLLIETPNSRQFADEWWYPRHPLTRETVIEDFAKFVEMLEKEPEHKLRAKDAHFLDQAHMLVEEAIPYTRIYEISEMKQLRADLVAHLKQQGHSGEIHMPRANPTPLRAIGALYENGVREQIERVYAADFERFGHLWDFTKTENAEPWSNADLATCENEAALGLRIAQLHRMARDERAANAKARQRIAELEAELAQPTTSPLTEAAAKVRGRLGRIRRG